MAWWEWAWWPSDDVFHENWDSFILNDLTPKAVALGEKAEYVETQSHLTGLETMERSHLVSWKLPTGTWAELLLPWRCALLPSSWPGEWKRKKVAKQHMIYSSSTPCSLWPFSVSVETLSDLHPCCLNSKCQYSVKQSAHTFKKEQPLVFYGITCSNKTFRLVSKGWLLILGFI